MKSILIKILTILLTLFFTSIVVFFQNYINVTYVIDLLLIIVFTILMFISKDINYKINGVIYWYALFVVLGLASTFWAIDAYDASYRSLQLFLILINLFVIYNSFRKFHLENTFLNGILLSSFVNYMIMLGFIDVPFNIIFPGGGDRAIGTMGNPNVFSIVMLISILTSILYINKKEEISKSFYYYQYVNIVLAYLMIIFTVSNKGILFGNSLVLFYFLLSMKSLKGLARIGILLLMISIYISYFIDWNDIIYYYNNVMVRFDAFNSSVSGQATGYDSTSIRMNLILSGIDAIQTKPLFGYGLANFKYVSFNGQYAHNNYIEVLANSGIVGGIIFYSMYIYLIKKIFNIKNNDLKYILLLFVLIFLLMDMAVVSYGSKFQIYTLLYLSFFAEINSRVATRKKN